MTGRDPSEPIEAWEAFLEYRALPPSTRSLPRLVRAGRSITTLKRMSLKWGWQKRLEAFEGAPSSPPVPKLAPVLSFPGFVPQGADGLTVGSTKNEKEESGTGGAGSRADVCTNGDLLEVVETTLRRELGREGAYTANELQKIAATATDVARQRREREVADAHVEYDLSRLTDDEAATLRALCAKARIAKPQVA